jgi:hypothetical protein
MKLLLANEMIWQLCYAFMEDVEVARMSMACKVCLTAFLTDATRAEEVRLRARLLHSTHDGIVELIGGMAHAARLPIVKKSREEVFAADLSRPITLGHHPTDSTAYVALLAPSRSYVDLIYRDGVTAGGSTQWRCVSDGGVMFHNHGELIRADGTMDDDIRFILRLVVSHALSGP